MTVVPLNGSLPLMATKSPITSIYWDINNQKGVMKSQNLHLRRLDDGIPRRHSCYEVVCQGSSCTGRHLPKNATYRFCYPSVIVSGIPKCGTSAMYELLTRFPNVHLMPTKENCPFARRRTHWQFFQSLPSPETVRPDALIVDGCIDLHRNMYMYFTLHAPLTLYIVMTRDYADYLWSSYNYWCKSGYDKGCNSNTRRLDPGQHARSPELFHALIAANAPNGTGTSGKGSNKVPPTVLTPLYNVAPCSNAFSFFSRSLTDVLWATVPRNHTVVLASEELAADPAAVWTKVATALDLVFSRSPPFSALSAAEVVARMGNFTDVRINTNSGNNSAPVGQIERHATPASAAAPGLYPASHHRPMLPHTRAVLDTCWHADCLLISQATGHLYPACRDAATDLIKRGLWRSFNELYQIHRSASGGSGAAILNMSTWSLDPAPYTGPPINERPMRLYGTTR